MSAGAPRWLSLRGPGPLLCAAGLPDCWGSRAGVLALGHHDGALFLYRDRALWAPLDGLVSLDGSGRTWTALTEAEDGTGTAWELTEGGWSPRVHLSSGLEGVRIEGGALVERGGARRRAVRLETPPSRVRLPMGAERGRIAVSPTGVAWADGPDLYLRRTGGRVRPLGVAPGPVTRLQCTAAGDVLATIGDEASLVRPHRGPARRVSFASEGPAVLGPRGALLQIGEDVLEVPWHDGNERWHRDRQLCGSATALLVPEEASVRTFDDEVVCDGLWPAAAAATADDIFGPGGRAWSRKDGSPGPLQPALLAEHLVAHEGHLFAVLEGEASVRDLQGRWGPTRVLPSPFEDPDALQEVRPARGGVVLVGDEERVHLSWNGQVRRGFIPPSRRAPGPPTGWHWNDAGLLLRLG